MNHSALAILFMAVLLTIPFALRAGRRQPLLLSLHPPMRAFSKGDAR